MAIRTEERTEELTARRALELTEELWRWLQKNPEKGKFDWPGWKKCGHMTASCPLCEYARQGHRICCLVAWSLSNPDDCLHKTSPYVKWRKSCSPRYQRQWAGRIVKLCKEALEVLDEKEEHTAGS